MKKLLLLILVMTVFISCSHEPQTLDEYKAAGKLAFGNLEYQKAVEYLSHYVQQNPSDREGLFVLGLAYLRQNMYDSATVYLKRADILYAKDIEINRELYNAAFLSENYDIARKALRTLIELNDVKEEDYLEDLANLSVAVNDFNFAHYYYGKLQDKYPDHGDWYLQNANSAAELGSLSVAIEILDQAVDQFGPKPEFQINQGLFFAAKGDYKNSEKVFRSLLARDTGSVQLKLNLAHTLSKMKDKAKLREAYDIYCENASAYPVPGGLDTILTRIENSLSLDSTQRKE
ncbi:MAG TPA: tetratricopeptide repeat protein [candidate division Zixibacteria bacterium]|mgnify:CR=1 FL=1|nr:tetratricopeptide repeat protein [candidate division Zixibacteria bacterium]